MPSRAFRIVGVGLATLFLVAHLPFLASTLEDIDSVNFALGIHDFDPSRHQPHPPGYPIFIALAKFSYALLGNDARALAVWGAIGGALAALPLLWMFWNLERLDRRLDPNHRRLCAVCAALVTLAAPLFWFTASRPMSDVAGLAIVLAAQAALIAGFVRQQQARDGTDRAAVAASGRLIVIGALVAGVALGFRAQAAWLTLPLLAVVILDRSGRGAAGALLGSAMTLSIGVVVWAVPLIVASGGWSRYVSALSVQAGEDIGGVDLLVSTPTIRHLATDLRHTFVDPWALTSFAVVVLVLASVGTVGLMMRNRRGLLLLAAAVLPYTVFHLVFQETVTVRYALPIVPAIMYLAVRGLDTISPSAVRAGAIALTTVGIATTMPALRTYVREGSPTSRAVATMAEDARSQGGARAGALGMHYAFVRALRRDPPTFAPVLDAPPKREWLSLVKYWRDGNRAPVWFLADPQRNDLALVDPASRKLMQRYTWTIPPDQFLGGIRPDEARWLSMTQPGWFLEEGWSLTPETAGVATMMKRSIADRPIAGFVRRRPIAATLMYGGRNLGAAGDPEVRFRLRVDGRVVDETAVRPSPGFFLRMIDLPAGSLAGDSGYAPLEIAAAAADGSARPVTAAVEQFDLQSAGAVVYGFDSGWHELEFSTTLRRQFRWSSREAVVRIHPGERDLTMRIAGESPLRYFDAPPAVTIRCGDRTLHQFSPSDDFDVTVPIPRDALNAANGRVVIATDRSFVPAERSARSGDRRALGLRIYSLTIE